MKHDNGNGGAARKITNSAEASVRAQNRSRYEERGFRQHVVLIRGQEGKEFRNCGDKELAQLQKEKNAIWCGGYYNGAFTG